MELYCSGNLEILKSPIGSVEFCNEYSSGRVQKSIDTTAAVSKLGDPHVSYYLIRWVCNASRLNHLMRTTPHDHCQVGTHRFDDATRSAFTEFSGIACTDAQWVQVCSSTRHAGLGLRCAVGVADAAYLASVGAVC